MKRIFSSALVIMLTIGAAQAQSTSTDKHEGHKKEHNKSFDDLNLSADQKARLQSIREDFKKQSADLKNNTSLSAEQKQAHRKELHQQFRSQSEAVFTPAQKDQMAKKRAEWKEKNKDGKKEWKKDGQAKAGKGNHMQRGQDFQKELGLTTDQQQKMEQMRTDFRNKFSTMRSDNSLTDEQKKAKMQEMRKQQQEQMKSILTPEQIQKMESLRQQRNKKNTE
jgi:Spy/CpxP family protein refolding chaperone